MNKKGKLKKDKVIPILCIVFAVVLVGMTLALTFGGRQKEAEFTPPPFEPAAVQGKPDVPEYLGYTSPYQEGMAYRFSICGKVTTEGTTATVYFTNLTENAVWLKLRVLDENGNTLGETGLIKPGEYVKTVEFTKTLPVGTSIRLKIMGYEPETYYSASSITLNTTIGGAAQ